MLSRYPSNKFSQAQPSEVVLMIQLTCREDLKKKKLKPLYNVNIEHVKLRNPLSIVTNAEDKSVSFFIFPDMMWNKGEKRHLSMSF
jgi:hypothetical protein